MSKIADAFKATERAKKALDNQLTILSILETIDTSMVDGFTAGSTGLILSVTGWDNYCQLRRGLDRLGAIPLRLAVMDSGQRQTYFRMPGISRTHWWNSYLIVINKPDLKVCERIQVGERVEPIYRVKCK